MDLPYSNILPVDKLSQCFKNTTNSYKFYWFLAILEEITQNQKTELKMSDLALRMVSLVWYPLDYYKLSFGKQDGFKKIARKITSKVQINNSVKSGDLIKQIESNLTQNEQKEIYIEVSKLLDWVPYRFIRPFWGELLKGEKDSKVNGRIRELARKSNQNKTHQSIYHFSGNNKRKIQVDEKWAYYLNKNQEVIRGFIYWHLIQFLQKHNPNVIGLSEKLFKPTKRELTVGRKFWRNYLKLNKNLSCIYSNAIVKNNFSLDHFLPWSYVAHDELWNLIPTLKNVNSSKGNQLPNLDEYLHAFSSLQYRAFHSFLENGDKAEDVLEGYAKLFNSDIGGLRQMPQNQFTQKIKDTIIPMHQIAQNMGFSSNWTYQL